MRTPAVRVVAGGRLAVAALVEMNVRVGLRLAQRASDDPEQTSGHGRILPVVGLTDPGDELKRGTGASDAAVFG